MATSQKGVGIPVKLLHEAEGHVVTVELKTGEMYRGELFEAEDNMNCQLKDVTATGRDGRVSQLSHIFIRGSRVRFFIIPDMLKNAPMFKRIDPKFKNKNMALGVGGRGRAAAGRGSFEWHLRTGSCSRTDDLSRVCAASAAHLVLLADPRVRGNHTNYPIAYVAF
ncbi:Small nuclear ribonucleoprotein Sm D3 [Tetrabaena socialis]|uniref:Small nuclear ribonucleoprotein Sm D3 n=1 Tax=Tetrabaena socialis TaxID=47790 RepID=A0A2J7ZVY2_9CHLO|nr:Small nuclear ribonucleoprotein Sm D3 [Tetrabaena socialis]|eukprot:PNH04408.1 Small nuclear ribonucleoprotein Sm D3 [Tetrabaena socialis]